MPLEFRKQRDGTLRREWFGRFEVNGKRYCYNLGIKIAGVPPTPLSLKARGDTDYEVSRNTAQIKLDRLIEDARSKQNATELVEKLYALKTGERIRSVKLDQLDVEWTKIPRKRKPDQRYAEQCQARLRKFAEFVKRRNGQAHDIAQVTRSTAVDYLESEAERGVTAKTINDTLKLLRASFRYLLPAGAINPFADIPTQDTETVFRMPFSPEELKAIVDTVREDHFLRPIIITGICTAMRKGDCCLLRWKEVDLERGFITVKTAKTGQTVSIPIFPLLHDELATRKNENGTPTGREDYVFPQQARMYLENASGISVRVKKLLFVALSQSQAKKDLPVLPEVSADEARSRGLAYIATIKTPEKRERMKAVFEAYMDGKKHKELLQLAGVSKGSVSGYLNEIEREVKCQIVRGRINPNSLSARMRADDSLLSVERNGGQRRASVRDFHSFRVTWVTLALTAGVPLELVQKVTGHKTTDIVLKHYFQPGREAFKQALNTAMPKLLTNGKVKTVNEQIEEIVIKATKKTAWKDIQRIKTLIEEQRSQSSSLHVLNN